MLVDIRRFFFFLSIKHLTKNVTQICSGRWNGDQIPNPADCGSFYVCDYGEPKLFKCLDQLLYDPVQRVCNWAYLVTCGLTGVRKCSFLVVF